MLFLSQKNSLCSLYLVLEFMLNILFETVIYGKKIPENSSKFVFDQCPIWSHAYRNTGISM